jgi:uncharacterized phage protein (TIGR01671 family)
MDMLQDVGFHPHIAESHDDGSFTITPSIGRWHIMQYTGLKDKNRVEIYEGDIITINHPYKERSWTGEVVYDGYKFNGGGFFFSHFDDPSSLFSEGTKYIEVIGNIYENPELLQKEEE